MKGAVKTSITPELIQKFTEIPRLVKIVEHTDNELGEQSHPQAALQVSPCKQSWSTGKPSCELLASVSVSPKEGAA